MIGGLTIPFNLFKKKSDDKDNPAKGVLRTDGLYKRENEDGDYVDYLRFYEDGLVISSSFGNKSHYESDQLDQLIAKQFDRNMIKQKGHYTIHRAQQKAFNDIEAPYIIKFTIKSSSGKVDYEGQAREWALYLTSYSHINGHRGEPTFHFVKLEFPCAPQADKAAIDSTFNYTVANGQTTVTGYLGSGGNVVIPDTLGGFPVVAIANKAFKGKNTMTSIALPQNLTTIGECAFDGCKSLTIISIPQGVTTIAISAFGGCSALTNITLPQNLKTIGDYAFTACKSLVNITIPQGAIAIGTWAFAGCSSLTSITLPLNLRTIGNSAFAGCKSLTSITLPQDLRTIGKFAFAYCSSLTNITLPYYLTSIGEGAFDRCSSLASITFQGHIPPSVGIGWIDGTNPALLGHACFDSSFPKPGNRFNGLQMGDYS